MTPINILLADDKSEICTSLEENIYISIDKFHLPRDSVVINKCFTEHAYEHGCEYINKGIVPDICIFDLVFNGYTGVDLYKYIIGNLNGGKRPDVCIYTGVEKTFSKRKEAEIMASSVHGSMVIVSKPNVSDVLEWFENLLKTKYNLKKYIDENDPFDLL